MATEIDIPDFISSKKGEREDEAFLSELLEEKVTELLSDKVNQLESVNKPLETDVKIGKENGAARGDIGTDEGGTFFQSLSVSGATNEEKNDVVERKTIREGKRNDDEQVERVEAILAESEGSIVQVEPVEIRNKDEHTSDNLNAEKQAVNEGKKKEFEFVETKENIEKDTEEIRPSVEIEKKIDDESNVVQEILEAVDEKNTTELEKIIELDFQENKEIEAKFEAENKANKPEAESENLPFKDLESVSDVQIPGVLPSLENSNVKEESLIQVNQDEENGTATKETSSEKMQKTEIQQVTEHPSVTCLDATPTEEKGEVEDNVLSSELLKEKVTELPSDKEKQLESRPNPPLEASSYVAETVNTQLETDTEIGQVENAVDSGDAGTDESATFFQALSDPEVTTHEKSGTPESCKDATMEDQAERKTTEIEPFKEGKPVDDEQFEVADSIEEASAQTGGPIVHVLGLTKGSDKDIEVTEISNKDESTGDFSNTKTEGAYEDLQGNSYSGEGEEPKLVKARESIEEDTEEIRPSVEAEGKTKQHGLLHSITTNVGIATQIDSQEEARENEEKTEEEAIESDDGWKEKSDNPSVKDVHEETGLEKEELVILSKDEDQDKEKEKEQEGSQGQGEDDVAYSQAAESEEGSQGKNHDDEAKKPEVLITRESIEEDTEEIKSSVETKVKVEQQELRHAITADVSTSTQTEPQEEIRENEEKNEEAIESDDGQKEESDNTSVKEVCEETIPEKAESEGVNEKAISLLNKDENQETEEELNMLEKRQGEDDVACSQDATSEEELQGKNQIGEDPGLVKTRESIEEDTEEIRSSVETKENAEQEVSLHAITTDVAISTKTESQEETPENQEKNEEEVIESDDGRKENSDCPSVKDVYEETGSEKVESEEGVKLLDVSGSTLNRKATSMLSKNEDQETEQELNDSENGQGEDDVACSQDATSEEELQGKNHNGEGKGGRFVTATETVEEDTEEIRSSIETKENMEQEKLLHAITTDVPISTRTESQEETTEKNEEEAIESDDGRKEKSDNQEVYQETGSEKAESEGVELSDNSGIKLNEKAIDISSKDEDQETERELLSEKGQGENDVACSQDASEEKIQGKNHDDEGKEPGFVVTRESIKEDTEEEIRSSAETKENVEQEELLHAIITDVSNSTQTGSQEENTNEEKNEEAIESNDGRKKNSDSPSVKEVCQETGSEKAESEGVELVDSSTVRLNEKAIETISKDEDKEKEHELNMSEEGRGEGDVTCSRDIASEERLEGQNHESEGKEPEFVKDRESIEEHAEEIKTSVETKEKVEQEGLLHVISADTSISMQTESQEEIAENEEKKKEEGIESDDGRKEKSDGPSVKEVCHETGSEKAEFEGVEISNSSAIMKPSEEVIAILSKDEDQENEQKPNMPEEAQGQDDVTCSRDIASEEELQGKNHDSEGKEPEFVKDRESIEEDVDEIKTSVETKEKVEEQELLDAITTDVSISTQTQSQEETTENEEIKEEEATESDDGRKEKSSSPLVKEVYEETHFETAESDDGVKLPDHSTSSTMLNEKEIALLSKDEDQEKEQELNLSEMDQGEDDVTSSLNASSEDIKETTISQQATTMVYFEEQGMIGRPKEFLKEETGDKSIDAQEANEQYENGEEDKREQKPKESVNITGISSEIEQEIEGKLTEDEAGTENKNEEDKISAIEFVDQQVDVVVETETGHTEDELKPKECDRQDNGSSEGIQPKESEDLLVCSSNPTVPQNVGIRTPEETSCNEIKEDDRMQSTGSNVISKKTDLEHVGAEDSGLNKNTNVQNPELKYDTGEAGDRTECETPATQKTSPEIKDEASNEIPQPHISDQMLGNSSAPLLESHTHVTTEVSESTEEIPQDIELPYEKSSSPLAGEAEDEKVDKKEDQYVDAENHVQKGSVNEEDEEEHFYVTHEQEKSIGASDVLLSRNVETETTHKSETGELETQVESELQEDTRSHEFEDSNSESPCTTTQEILEAVGEKTTTEQVKITEQNFQEIHSEANKEIEAKLEAENQADRTEDKSELKDGAILTEPSVKIIGQPRYDSLDEAPRDERVQALEDATALEPQVNLSNIESTDSSSESEKLPIQTLESVCDAQSPEVSANSDDSKVEETGEYTEENNVKEEHETTSNEISSAEKKERTDSEQDAEHPSKLCHDVVLIEETREPHEFKPIPESVIEDKINETTPQSQKSDIVTEEQNIAPFGELKPTSESKSEKQTSETTPQPEKSDVISGNSTEYETLESKLEHNSDKGSIDVERAEKEVVTLTPANQISSTQECNVEVKDVILTEEISHSDPTPVVNLEVTEVRAENKIGLEDLHADEDLGYESKASSTVEASEMDKKEGIEQHVTITREVKVDSVVEPSAEERIPAVEDATTLEPPVNVSSTKFADSRSESEKSPITAEYRDEGSMDEHEAIANEIASEGKSEQKTGNEQVVEQPSMVCIDNEEITYSDPIPSGNPEVTEVRIDGQIGQEDLHPAEDIGCESKSSSTVEALKTNSAEGTEQSVKPIGEAENDWVDEALEEESIPALEDATALEPQLHLSNIESTDSPSESEKLPMQALESVCDAQSPEVVAHLEESKVKETIDCTDETNEEKEQETIANKISSAEKKEQTTDSEQVAEHPSELCHEAVVIEETHEPRREFKPIPESAIEDPINETTPQPQKSDIITEEKNIKPLGELKPASESISEEQTSETTPQPEKSDVTSRNDTEYETLESKLEHSSDKDSINVETGTKEVSQSDPMPVGDLEVTELRAGSQIGFEDLQAEEDLGCESKASSTVEASQTDMKEGIEQRVTITREVKTDSVYEPPPEESYRDAVAEVTVHESFSQREEELVSMVPHGQLSSPMAEDQTNELVLEEKETKSGNEVVEDVIVNEAVVEVETSGESRSIKDNTKEASCMQNLLASATDEVCQIKDMNSSPNETFGTKGSVEATQDLATTAENHNLKAKTVTVIEPNVEKTADIATSGFERSEEIVTKENVIKTDADKEKETLNEPDVDGTSTAKTTSDSISNSVAQDIEVRAEESSDHGDMHKLEEETTEVFEITSEGAEIVTEGREIPAILIENLQDASREMLPEKHDPEDNTLLSQNDKKIEESISPPSVESKVETIFKEAPVIEVQNHEKGLDYTIKARSVDATNNAECSEIEQRHFNVNEATLESISQENQSEQKKEADENIESEISSEKVPKQTPVRTEVSNEPPVVSVTKEQDRRSYPEDNLKEQEYSGERTHQDLEAAKEPLQTLEFADKVEKDEPTDIQEETVIKCNVREEKTEDRTTTFELHHKEKGDEIIREGTSTEAATPIEDVNVSDKELHCDMDKTDEVYEAEKEILKEDVHLESTGDTSKISEEVSKMKQEPLHVPLTGERSREFAVTHGTSATESLENTVKYVTDDLAKVSEIQPEIPKHEDSSRTLDKQLPKEPHRNESTESKFVTGNIDASDDQVEPTANSLNADAEELKATTASGTEPQCSSEVFNEEKKTGDEKEKSETAEPDRIVFPGMLHESTKGNSQVAENFHEEKDRVQKKEQQADKEETGDRGVKTEKENEEEEEEDNEDDQKTGSSSDAPVMVEASTDMEVKVHKKSHNILSGVGSKVKHSIAKVKKAITGKSSHPKPPSPKQKDEVIT